VLEWRQFGGGGGWLEIDGDRQFRLGGGHCNVTDVFVYFGGILLTRSRRRASAHDDLLVAWIPTR